MTGKGRVPTQYLEMRYPGPVPPLGPRPEEQGLPKSAIITLACMEEGCAQEPKQERAGMRVVYSWRLRYWLSREPFRWPWLLSRGYSYLGLLPVLGKLDPNGLAILCDRLEYAKMNDAADARALIQAYKKQRPPDAQRAAIYFSRLINYHRVHHQPALKWHQVAEALRMTLEVAEEMAANEALEAQSRELVQQEAS